MLKNIDNGIAQIAFFNPRGADQPSDEPLLPEEFPKTTKAINSDRLFVARRGPDTYRDEPLFPNITKKTKATIADRFM